MTKKIRRLIFPVFLLFACGNPAAIPTSPSPSIRYLALGDSYTIGQSVAESERWPNQLATALSKKGINPEISIIARTGWTTADLQQELQANPPQGTYDLVSLLIGVNNQYRGHDASEYREQFRFLLNKSIEYTEGNSDHVIVLSIPDWSVTRFAIGQRVDVISKEIDVFNAINREETVVAGAHYVDITPISRQALENPSLLADDGLHPSGKMYGLWVKETLPIVLKMFEQKQ